MTHKTIERPPPSRRYLGILGRAIDRRVTTLQREFLDGWPSARAQLAQLRRGVGKEPGSVPEIWSITVGELPPSLTWDRDEPTRAEHAAHIAMTLYATHQQSQATGAHVPGVSFGQACAALRGADVASEQAVTRRFMAAATSATFAELVTHVRGLVTQLRARGIALDYAAFADDVQALLDPRRQTDVRLRWGRHYYRMSSTDQTESQPTVRGDLP